MALKLLPLQDQPASRVRALVFETRPGERYAINADRLHSDPNILNPLTPAFRMTLLVLESLAAGVAFLAIVGAFLVSWWIAIPGIAAAIAMLRANRRTAARMAKTSAIENGNDFVYLYRMGVIWRI